MSDGDNQQPSQSARASAFIDTIKLDFNTIKIIVLTACVVVVLISIPLFFILRTFVTFDALDSYFKVTESVRPKILRNISEEIETGYSKNFIFDSPHPTDYTMLFYASAHQKVTLSVSADAVGRFPKVLIRLNNCSIDERNEAFHLYERDLTSQLDNCQPDEPNLHTLKVVLPDGMPKGTTLEMKCLVLVGQRVRAHLDDNTKK